MHRTLCYPLGSAPLSPIKDLCNSLFFTARSREPLLRRGGVLRVDLDEHGGELGLVLVRPLLEPLVEYAQLALEHARTLAGIAFGDDSDGECTLEVL